MLLVVLTKMNVVRLDNTATTGMLAKNRAQNEQVKNID